MIFSETFLCRSPLFPLNVSKLTLIQNTFGMWICKILFSVVKYDMKPIPSNFTFTNSLYTSSNGSCRSPCPHDATLSFQCLKILSRLWAMTILIPLLRWTKSILTLVFLLLELHVVCELYLVCILRFWTDIDLSASGYHVCSFVIVIPHSGWYFLVPSICLRISWIHCF